MNFITSISLIAVISSTVTSIAAIFIAVLTYKRNRQFENANIIYKIKIDGYLGLVEKLVDLIGIINKGTENISNKSYTNHEIISVADNVDSKAEELFNYALKYSLIFPEETINQLDIIHKIVNAELPGEFQKSGNIEGAIKLMQEYFQKLSNNIDILYDRMRKDLGSKKLNMSLSKRLS
jgi:arginyl-tRNA synthetase